MSTLNVLPAMAWTQELNGYDIGGTPDCGSATYPCIFWPEAQGTSSTVYGYFDSSVDSDSYSFTTAINRAFADFRAAPAYNPYLYQCTNSALCASIIYYGSTSLPCLEYGETHLDGLGSLEYGALGNGTNGYYKLISYIDVYFNTSSVAQWNNSLTWSANGSTCQFQADGRKVSTHETGHAVDLGHTSYTAVMHQGPENFYSLQTNDIQGLQATYTGSSPSS